MKDYDKLIELIQNDMMKNTHDIGYKLACEDIIFELIQRKENDTETHPVEDIAK